MMLPRTEMRRARIEIIPMIDAIFFLLVFFIMTSLAMIPMPGHKVELPKSQTAALKPMEKVVVSISREGDYYIDRDKVADVAAIRDGIAARLKADPKLVVVINCDRSQNITRFAQAFDLIKQANAENVMVATEPQAPSMAGPAVAPPGGDPVKLPNREMRRARIEIIPMIDAIFFLLVFFMIASLSEQRMRAIALAMPRNANPAPPAATAGPGQPGGNLILTMSDRGDYTLGTRRIGPNTAAVESALTRVLQTSSPKSVVLNFTGGQSTQALIGVLDLLNRARSTTGHDVPVLIATEPIDQNGRALRPLAP